MKQSNKETRLLNVEFKALDIEEDKMIIEGYAITFNTPATHFGMTEIISDRALDNCDMSDVPLKYNHNDSYPIMARTRGGSLRLEKDAIGLKFHADLPKTQANKDIYELITSGVIDKCSFAMTVEEDSYDYETDTRTILSIDKLYDISVVDVPFYDSTSVYARGLDTSEEQAKKYFEKKQQQKNKQERRNLVKKLKKQELLNRL